MQASPRRWRKRVDVHRLNAVGCGWEGESGPAVGEERQLRETGDPGIVLSVLSSIERDSAITQRKLARELGIALGLANAYLRRCVRKGLVKMSQVPLNRYAYYLTPQGFAEKSRLTGEYLSYSLDFFRRARSDCAALFRHCEARGWRNVALYGASDLAEIAILSAGETTVEVTCIIDAASHAHRCGGRPVVPDLAAAMSNKARPLNAIILTDTQAPQASFDALLAEAKRSGLPEGAVLAPSILRISPASAPIEEDEAAT
jgi:DNA-binding MarR family transcriptional regulator